MLNNSYFKETKIKICIFDNSDLSQAKFLKTSLKDVGLSTSKIEGIAITTEDIRGAVVDRFQASLTYCI